MSDSTGYYHPKAQLLCIARVDTTKAQVTGYYHPKPQETVTPKESPDG